MTSLAHATAIAYGKRVFEPGMTDGHGRIFATPSVRTGFGGEYLDVSAWLRKKEVPQKLLDARVVSMHWDFDTCKWIATSGELSALSYCWDEAVCMVFCQLKGVEYD